MAEEEKTEVGVNKSTPEETPQRQSPKWHQRFPRLSKLLVAAGVGTTVAAGGAYAAAQQISNPSPHEASQGNPSNSPIVNPENMTPVGNINNLPSGGVGSINIEATPAFIPTTASASAPESEKPTVTPSSSPSASPTSSPPDTSAPAKVSDAVSSVAPTAETTPIPPNNLALTSKPDLEIVRKAAELYPHFLGVVGYTTDKYLLSLSKTRVKDVQKYPDGTTKYTITAPYTNTNGMNEILTKDGVVIFEKVLTEDQNYKHPQFSTFQQKVGPPNPQNIIQGADFSLNLGADGQTIVYPEKGDAFVTNKTTGDLMEIQNFAPMTKQQYLQNFGKIITTVNQPSK